MQFALRMLVKFGILAHNSEDFDSLFPNKA